MKPPEEPSATEHDTQESSVPPTDTTAQPVLKARLSNPRWGKSEGQFDSNITASVDGELDPGIEHLTRIAFQLFAKRPDGSSEWVEAKEAHLKQGVATVEFKLWTPAFRDKTGKAPREADYVFVAKHRDSQEVRSNPLPVTVERRARKLAARDLQRGVRGEDVLAWQRFLMRMRQQPYFAADIQEIRQDGIFGLETRTATLGFQTQTGIKADGIVGPDTREQAELLGALFEEDPSSGRSESVPVWMKQGKLPVYPPPKAPPPPEPPPGPKGSTRDESWKRLRAEGWRKNEVIKASLEKAHAVVQSVEDGSGDFLYDEYKVAVNQLPADVSPAALVLELATHLNESIKDTKFDFINRFKRRRSGAPEVGEIIDIDIMGPDNGSVILGELGPSYFIYETIDCPETWSHPENGSREFGFQYERDTLFIYTRGLSRPGNFLIGLLASEPQRQGWTALMEGLCREINTRGGKCDPTSFSMTKDKRDQ